MASVLKSLRGYIAPIFVVYTILVTYFLAQRAWDDVSNLLRRRNEVKFLDVLVQEERRHLRSFQDVVKYYRGDKYGDNQEEDNNVTYNHQQQNGGAHADNNNPQIELAPRSVDLYRQDNKTGTYNANYFPKDFNLLQEQEQQNNREQKPFFQVEVEEWDANTVHSKQLPKPLNNSLQDSEHSKFENRALNNKLQNSYLNSSNFIISRSYHQNAMQPRKEGYIPGDTSYTTEFCENAFDVFNLKPSICIRELAETGAHLHVNISSYSLFFRELGDIFIFSAFLDTREKSYIIRLITLGRQGLDDNKSVYWCVFYLRSMISNSNQNLVSDLNSPTIDRKHSRQGTQLTYYSASDGHYKNSQFYIMSCPVPEAAKASLLPPHRGLFQIVTGNLKKPFLEKHQESLTLKVIINNPEPMTTPLLTEHRNSYFDNMEHDLLTLNLHNITSNSGNITISTSDNNSKKYTQPNKDNRIELDRINVNNVSEYKIVTCVAPLQGGVSVVQMVEFIELTLLLGSQHVIFYTFQVTEETMRVLYMYVGRGLVTALPWNIPNPQSIWANGRDMALNDCLYRTMHVYDYALFLDIDEFLVPRVTPDIPSFLKYLKAVHKFNFTKFSDLVFSSAYFPPPTKIQHKNLTTMEGFTRDINKLVSLKSLHRTYINPKHTLRLIKISKALRVGAGERKRTSFIISPRFAFVNHYSYCPQEARVESKDDGGVKQNSQENNTQDICSRTKQDFIMWRYKSILIQRVKDSVRRLNR